MVKYEHDLSKHLKRKNTRAAKKFLLSSGRFDEVESREPLLVTQQKQQQQQRSSSAAPTQPIPNSNHFRHTLSYTLDEDSFTCQDKSACESSDGGFSEDWDEGRTLIENLKNSEDDARDAIQEEYMARADGIQPTMSAYSKDLQQELADTLVPAMDHIRLIHGMLESSVETKLIAGTIAFDQAADDYQKTAAERRTAMTDLIKASNLHNRLSPGESTDEGCALALHQILRDLFSKLKDEYAHHAQLAVNLDNTIAAVRARVSQSLFEDTTNKLEDLKLKLDRKSVALSKPDNLIKQQELLLKTFGGKK
ncbi:hypothetical protein FRB97_007232 [Tulasnella sp. 331]|nr:hypothetical protein FRB97_007232 [Tulasnella sp. 331]